MRNSVLPVTRRPLRTGVPLGLALLLGLWPTLVLAVGSDTGPGVPTNVGKETQNGAHYRYWFVPAHGGGGGTADPDTWDSATVSGTYYVEIIGAGTSDPEAQNCTASAESSQTSLELPAMSAGSNPSPQRETGLGGIVNAAASFWVDGYGGEERRSPDAVITIRSCHVDTSTTPPTTTSTTVTHRAWISYRPTGLPAWSWGDSTAGSRGYSTGHTYQISSGICDPPSITTCVDVPGRGRLFVVRFGIPLQVTYHFDDLAQGAPRTEFRNRAFPVREVQSIVTASQPNP
jgi:hypothetical protein